VNLMSTLDMRQEAVALRHRAAGRTRGCRAVAVLPEFLLDEHARPFGRFISARKTPLARIGRHGIVEV
jgi:hypothetical protein